MMSAHASRIVEAALISSGQPLTIKDLQQVLGEGFDGAHVESLLQGLVRACEGRGIELVQVASGWRYQTCSDLRPYMDRLHPEKPPRYTRATLETLAIIAYRQPVTRGDMEDIRGVTINAQLLKQLEDRGWVEVIGHRDTVGRPALFATTRQFLDDLGLASLDQLPELVHTLADHLSADSLLTPTLAGAANAKHSPASPLAQPSLLP